MNNEANPIFLITHEERLAGEQRRRVQSCGLELLNMLERMLYEAREGEVTLCTMEHAEKAIAKAKGNP